MNQVRPLLAVVAAALTLAACEGTGSITDPAFRSDKAAPAAHAGSGLHADNGGWVGSGYDLVPCRNGGGLGSGTGGAVAGCSSDTGVFAGSGNVVERAPAVGVSGHRGPAIQRPRASAPGFGTPSQPSADCVPSTSDSGGFVGSGYNYCPPV